MAALKGVARMDKISFSLTGVFVAVFLVTSDFDCYLEKCVGNFVACARQSRAEDVFDVCKLLYKSCAASCSFVEDEVILGL
ncbi:hypothetical protein ACJMK2_041234 [Sinanodonta woodiana]|uniref:Uncharacterized protein n=1 Tax=Sinanodonta woodiana TaxID=1069815 RepID=A0ABD3W434_SINWO